MFLWCYVLKAFILLPGILVLGLLLGLIICRWSRKIGYWLIGLTILCLYGLSLPIVASLLAKPLQNAAPLNLQQVSEQGAQAIVVLSGGVYPRAPEYGLADTASAIDIARVRYAFYLYQKTHLPILITGGRVFGEKIAEADLMKSVLKKEYCIPVKWVETQSLDTLGNAKYSSTMLKRNHIQKIFLVTDAVHMPRASYVFRREGIDVIAAPTNFITLPDFTSWFLNWIPTMDALSQSAYCLHEYIGNVFYRFRNG